jgi:hypothetical protein
MPSRIALDGRPGELKVSAHADRADRSGSAAPKPTPACATSAGCGISNTSRRDHDGDDIATSELERIRTFKMSELDAVA